jgi:hypothetical protein
MSKTEGFHAIDTGTSVSEPARLCEHFGTLFGAPRQVVEKLGGHYGRYMVHIEEFSE